MTRLKSFPKVFCVVLKKVFYTTCPLKFTEKLAKNFRQVWCYRDSSDGPKQDTRLPHDLPIAKLSAYGFEDSATSLISDYLSKRYLRVKIGSIFSSYLEILRGVHLYK